VRLPLGDIDTLGEPLALGVAVPLADPVIDGDCVADGVRLLLIVCERVTLGEPLWLGDCDWLGVSVPLIDRVADSDGDCVVDGVAETLGLCVRLGEPLCV